MTSRGQAGSLSLCVQCTAFFHLIFADDIERFCINSLTKRLIIKGITEARCSSGDTALPLQAGMCLRLCSSTLTAWNLRSALLMWGYRDMLLWLSYAVDLKCIIYVSQGIRASNSVYYTELRTQNKTVRRKWGVRPFTCWKVFAEHQEQNLFINNVLIFIIT